MPTLETRLSEALENPLHGWSVGTFGAIGEFVRDAGEPAEQIDRPGFHQIVTPRGGLQVRMSDALTPVAFDTLSSDGETWGQTLALCLPASAGDRAPGVVTALGQDADALRPQDREAELFDMGVGLGLVRMCARTTDPTLIAALRTIEGRSIGDAEAVEARALILKTSPHRVMLSPVARLEVYAAIPAPDGKSPEGPHTHLLPKLLAAKRTHAANAPIPEGYQPVLTMHPRSPWRDGTGMRTPYAAEFDAWFAMLLNDYGLPEDQAIRVDVERALDAGADPASFPWPNTRRGRTVGRITLRRRAVVRDDETVSRWRSLYDRRSDEEVDEERAQHG